MFNKKPKETIKKSAKKEWWDSIVFAVVAATLIRFFIFEAYVIPTPSMEGSLMVGDYLFVSKLHYGVRTPKTPLQVPLTHQKIWGTDIPSFSTLLDLPIFRLPGFTSPKTGDAVVFNVPNFAPDGEMPTDLKTYYIKRCIGTPGDKLEIKDRQVYLNGKPMKNPEKLREKWYIETSETLGEEFFRKYNIVNYTTSATENTNWYPAANEKGETVGYWVNTDIATFNEIKKLPFVKSSQPELMTVGQQNQLDGGTKEAEITPMAGMAYKWNMDQFGPLVVPQKGMTVTLDSANVDQYKYVIKHYESNKNVAINGYTISVEGKAITSYTFKQDYFFMMGDNRHNSADSRFWGFVPHDHVVGKAMFVWMSVDPSPNNWYNKIRWGNIFRLVD